MGFKNNYIVISEQNIRLIFGLKLRQLRQKQGLSPKELADTAGISISYLNEIEKGKKYPKAEKIAQLAEVLDTDYDELVSLRLSRNLAPITELLNSDLLSLLPLDLFGIGADDLVEIIANAPAKVSAFISTIVGIARNYEMRVEQFYLTALRSYQEMHDNYFEDLETIANKFRQENGLDLNTPISLDWLTKLLKEKYEYIIDETQIAQYPTLKSVRSVYSFRKNKNRLLLNNNLNEAQKIFQLAKEVGYQFMELKDRNTAPSWVKAESFEQVLNNFKASYFAGALLIPNEQLAKDLAHFFITPTWNGDVFLNMMNSYRVSPETFLHRLTSIVPHFFNINQLFFLRFSTSAKDSNTYDITKELHLSNPHNPHANALNEHYCRRWVSINSCKEFELLLANDKTSLPIVRAQRSHYINSDNEYFCISVARSMNPTPDTISSVTIGFAMNAEFKSKVAFWHDSQVPVRLVNETCERCPLSDCQERVEPAHVLKQQAATQKIEKAVEDLVKRLA